MVIIPAVILAARLILACHEQIRKRVDLEWMMWWMMLHISERAATTE